MPMFRADTRPQRRAVLKNHNFVKHFHKKMFDLHVRRIYIIIYCTIAKYRGGP